LAVALGIGTAVVTGYGVARADSADSGLGPKATDSSETKSDTTTAGKQGADAKDTTDSDSTTGNVDSKPADSGTAPSQPGTGHPKADRTDGAKPAPRPQRKSATTLRKPPKPDIKSAADVDTDTPGVDTKSQAAQSDPAVVTANPAAKVATLSVSKNLSVTKQDVVAPVAATQTAPQMVTSALAVVGFDSLADPAPVAPAAPTQTLLGLLQFAWRDITRTFLNQSPTIAYDRTQSDVVDGSLVGSVTAGDPDGAVTLSASKPAHGEVTLNQDGSFTYTPDESYNGQDSFRITATEADSGFHIHGLSGLINLVTFGLIGDSGHSATQTITIGGYTDSTVVSGLDVPTDFRFLPDGRFLFAEKGGAIKVANNDGQLQSTPLITLPTTTEWARGLAGVEVDPQYQQNGYLYVSYIDADNYERLSRLTVTDPTADVLTVDPDSEVVLVKGTQPAGDDHHGGGLAFGPDGKLYWSVGDNVCCSVVDGSNSQDLSNIYGKVLRLNPDGSAPDDNPFPDAPLIYATGFRNPFRLTFTPDGQLLVVDVGQNKWEEVNLVTPGGNYGWPNAEGPCDGIGRSSCSTPSSYDNPIYTYRHTSGGNSITSVMEYTGASSARGGHTVFIADYSQGWVKELTFNSDYSSLISAKVFDAAAPGNTVGLIQGPDGAIYQLTIEGTLTRIGQADDGLSTV
jgi:VCBS repeat-containing protein